MPQVFDYYLIAIQQMLMSPQLRACVQMSSMAILSINQDLTFIMSLFCLLEAIEEHIITRLLDGTYLCEKTHWGPVLQCINIDGLIVNCKHLIYMHAHRKLRLYFGCTVMFMLTHQQFLCHLFHTFSSCIAARWSLLVLL